MSQERALWIRLICNNLNLQAPTPPMCFPLTHMGCAVCTSSEMLRGPIHLLTLVRFLVVPLLQISSGAVAVFNAHLLELHLQLRGDGIDHTE